MSPLAAVVAAASAATSVLAIATPQRTVADGSSFIPPPSCTATATTRAVTATLSSAASARPLSLSFGRQATSPGGGGSASGFPARWINRHPDRVLVAGRCSPLLAEASGSAESAEGAAVSSSSPTDIGDGGSKGERGSGNRDELELR